MAECDKFCKILAEKYPRDFIRWLLNEEPRTAEELSDRVQYLPL